MLPDEGNAGPGLCQLLPAPANVLFHSCCVQGAAGVHTLPSFCATVTNDVTRGA